MPFSDPSALWSPAAVAFGLTILGTSRVLKWLHARNILDVPNDRSSHSRPTPRGGGLAVTPAVLAAWAMVASTVDAREAALTWMLTAGAGILLVASWIDDRRSLPAAPRFALQTMLVMVALAMLPPGAMVFQGWLPFWLDRALAAAAWIWFINLYNFMDGIDGITGVETASLGIGVAAISLVAGVAVDLIPLGLACAAAGLGFLRWNWHPARIFLGDSGSIPLGFLLGGLLIRVALEGHLVAALILPGYYLADATLTLASRILRGENIWRAHRQHFYQRAVRGGMRHDRVVMAVMAANLGLIAAAAATAAGHLTGGAATAVAIVGGLLVLMRTWSRRPAS